MLNQSDGVPSMQSVTPLPTSSTKQMGLDNDEDNLLLAPSISDRGSLASANFLDATDEE